MSLYISNTFSLSFSLSVSQTTSHNPNKPLPETLTVTVYDEHHAAPLVAQLQRRFPEFRLRSGKIPGNDDDPRDDVSHRRERQRRWRQQRRWRCRRRRRRFRVPLRVPRDPLAEAPFRPPAGTGCFCFHGAGAGLGWVDLDLGCSATLSNFRNNLVFLPNPHLAKHSRSDSGTTSEQMAHPVGKVESKG